MTNIEGRVIQLELAVKAIQAQLSSALTRLDAVEQLARSYQGITYNWGGGGGGSASYWAMAPFGGIAASTGTFPDITPATFTTTVYQEVGGVLNAMGVRQLYWWYRDPCPQYRLLPLQQTADDAYDVIANSCTAVNP